MGFKYTIIEVNKGMTREAIEQLFKIKLAEFPNIDDYFKVITFIRSDVNCYDISNIKSLDLTVVCYYSDCEDMEDDNDTVLCEIEFKEPCIMK